MPSAKAAPHTTLAKQPIGTHSAKPKASAASSESPARSCCLRARHQSRADALSKDCCHRHGAGAHEANSAYHMLRITVLGRRRPSRSLSYVTLTNHPTQQQSSCRVHVQLPTQHRLTSRPRDGASATTDASSLGCVAHSYEEVCFT